MCQFFSGIIEYKHKGVIYDLDKDSHEDLIKKGNLDDSKREPNFVRVELLPQDNNIFNHKLDNWKLKIDQDFIPNWFDEQKAEKQMKEAIKEVWKERF